MQSDRLLLAGQGEENLEGLFQQGGNRLHPIGLVGELGEVEKAEIESPMARRIVPAVETSQNDKDEEDALEVAIIAKEKWHKKIFGYWILESPSLSQ